jgi:activating signal cointegrator complex subunit 2
MKPKLVNKGKQRAIAPDIGSDQVHIHQASLISQVQDIFPELGSGFVAKLLDEYQDDTEQVISHLLEESLPPHLGNADRSETL